MTTTKRPARTRAPKKTTARKPQPSRPPAASAPKKPAVTAQARHPNQPVLDQIRELEAQLDKLIDEASHRDVSELAHPDDEDEIVESTPPSAGGALLSEPVVASPRADPMVASSPGKRAAASRSAASVVVAPASDREVPEAPPSGPEIPVPLPTIRASAASFRDLREARESEPTVFDTARELLSSNFYLRKWGRVAMRGRSEEVDDFGFDPIYDQKVRSVLEFLYTRYFRVTTTGISHVPARGRCLLVANHSGTLPLDGVMLKTAVKLEHPTPRDVRWLTEDFITHMPWLGSTMNRLGAVRACQENAERLLAKEQLVAVFPEGVKGIGKLFGERYRLQRFGRGGFIKLCLRTETPIVPVAVVGAEETNPLLFRFEYLSKALGVPYVPVTPTFPALGPLGLVPAPTKWEIQFGEPIDFAGYGRDAADDELLVGKLAERVRATIQGMLDRAVAARKSVFFG